MTTKSKTRQMPRHRRSPPFLEPVFLATGALNSGTGLGVPQSLSTTDRRFVGSIVGRICFDLRFRSSLLS